jgi:hydrogenase small subunit
VVLHHPFFALSAGREFLEPYRRALRGDLDGPHVIVLEGSATDETRAGDGHWCTLGSFDAQPDVPDAAAYPVATMDWVRALAPRALAAIAVGTCATWGGVPAAMGSVTGAMSLTDLLGRDYRSAAGLPVINLPGCAPVPDTLMESLTAILLHLGGAGPEPELDDLGRPAWLYAETVHRTCLRAGYYEEGRFARAAGESGCLVELGCWGPVVQCTISSRGAVGGLGGCMSAGGACIGCTMPGFPDRFTPFYESPAGAALSARGAEAMPLRPLPLVSVPQRAAAPATAARTAPAVVTPARSGWSFDDAVAPGLADTPFYELWRVREDEPEPLADAPLLAAT